MPWKIMTSENNYGRRNARVTVNTSIEKLINQLSGIKIKPDREGKLALLLIWQKLFTPVLE